MSVEYRVGDVLDRLAEIPDRSVHSVITSPPYWRKRRYTDDPREIGQEPSPGDFLATLLGVTDELWRILRDDGVIWINLGDTAAGSGGWGSDVDRRGRGGGVRWVGTNGTQTAGADMPLPKSICWIPELFGASLAYGRNLLTGESCQQWITRPKVTWCKPAPTPGEIRDKFREADELIVWAAKRADYWFDLDAVREPPKEDWGSRVVNSGAFRGHPNEKVGQTKPGRACNPRGVPPLTWGVLNTANGETDHVAPFPEDLIRRPLLASCPQRCCSTCGRGHQWHYERSWELDESRPQAKRAMELAAAGGLGPAHFEAIAARGLAEGGKAVAASTSSGRNSASVIELAAEAKAVLGGYMREFIGAPKIRIDHPGPCCEGATWIPGTVLDPFGGSGTVGRMAVSHGRDAILIDLDARNAELARSRVGMFLDVDDGTTEVVA